MQTQCTIPNCSKPTKARGWCTAHYWRWLQHGSPFTNLRPEQILGDATYRFWRKADPCRTDGCAVWVTGTNKLGYGRFYWNGRGGKAHHFLVGRPPRGLEWDHLCRNPACVWPAHLELVSHAENMRRGNAGLWQRLKTHCAKGHPYDETNTRYDKKGHRRCRACKRLEQRGPALDRRIRQFLGVKEVAR